MLWPTTLPVCHHFHSVEIAYRPHCISRKGLFLVLRSSLELLLVTTLDRLEVADAWMAPKVVVVEACLDGSINVLLRMLRKGYNLPYELFSYRS